MNWWVLVLFVLPATVIDLKTREVPDLLSLSLVGWAIVVTGLHLHDVGWASLFGGFLVGIALGGLFFAMGGIGGGDVKFIAALGAALGHTALFPALFWTALSGAALALVALCRGKRDLAYLPAIAIGLAISQLCHVRFIHV
jgi:Flp pilus assembly protein protease CpaA